ncbi:MAG TPA: hypothetical protein ENO22_10380 [candidate division Zixibacteria bacterium]|nr:hypothetical protein [candidate division Zixibacteria bacterium]HEQ99733.1 hypothetical protein [candidate division Zixibacteria bacterium]
MALSLTIAVEKNEYLPGESIPVEMTLVNITDSVVNIPNFAYNSDLTEIIISDSEGNEIGRLNDPVRQLLLGFMQVEVIKPPEQSLSPGSPQKAEFDVSQYVRLTKAGKYQLQGSFRYDDEQVLSDPVEINILEGKASGLYHKWQYQMGGKWRCQMVYRDHDKLMHMLGYRHNPGVIDYNLPLMDDFTVDEYALAFSCYDKDDYLPWILGVKDKKLVGGKIDTASFVTGLEELEFKGKTFLNAAVETYDRTLILPEVLKDKILFHLFDAEGKKNAQKEIGIGSGTEVLDASAYKSGEYLMVYRETTSKGSDIYAAVSKKADLSDMEQRKLVGSSKEFDAAVISPTVKMPSDFYAVSFEPEEKALMIYTVSLNPDIRTQVPPKVILKSQGELQLHSFAVEQNGAAYVLFIEDGKKLLYYNVSDNSFEFITEEEFSDPQLIITESDGVFLGYIDHDGIIQFKHMEKVIKRH